MKFIRVMLVVFVGLFVATVWAEETAPAPTPPVTIYTAKKIITMNSLAPEATAVAVKEGRILSVGTLDEVKMGLKPQDFTVNNTYANNTIVPGLIEAHAHITMLAVFLTHPYVGFWDIPGLNGEILTASKNKEAVIEKLKAAEKAMADPNEVLFAWGFDPIYFNNEDLTAADLDQVSTKRPIFVLNASEHIAYINTFFINKMGFNAHTMTPGVIKGADGKPNGVLKEMEAAGPVILTFFKQLFSTESFKIGLYGLGETAHRLGLTTYSDLLFGGPGEEEMLDVLKQAANDPNYALRMVIVYNGVLLAEMEKNTPGQGIHHLDQLIEQNTDKLRFGHVKFVSDGSIQGFTARLNWPGYFNGAPNGLFNTTTEQLKEIALPFWKGGYPIHVHVNGDQATQSALDTLQYFQTVAPNRENIFVLEHNQMANQQQFKRARMLNAYTNIFANHVYYWGDQHYSILLGPDRANVMDAALEAKRQGMIFSLHTDAPVTPLGPLHSMWAAMTRVTASGRVLGPSLRITAEDALRAVTLNAAYLLNLQNEIGSIEIGKRADFTVLGRDPLVEPAMSVKDIPVVATIQSGLVYPIKAALVQTAIVPLVHPPLRRT